jgi:hypothetical protein
VWAPRLRLTRAGFARNIVKKKNSERGFALIATIFAISFVLLILMTVSVQTLTTTRILQLRLRYQGQGLNAAHAGLIEGLDWFRRQTTQPVTLFNPQRNLSASPPVNDTDLTTTPVSLNRDYQISSLGRVWGHYEVVRGTAGTNQNVLDLTQNRRGSGAGNGAVWQLESLGGVYIRNDPNALWNVAPNVVLARRTLRAEIQRVTVNLPAAAAVIIQAAGLGGGAFVGTSGNSRARVIGGSTGIGVASISGAPTVDLLDSPISVLSGTPANNNGLAAANFTIQNVFGVSTIADLSAVADISASSVTAIPNPIRTTSIIVLNMGAGTATFDSTTPLNGSGILVVNGNLTINGGNSNFNGVIFVTGNYLQVGPSTVNGTVMLGSAGSTFTIRGSSDFGELFYDRFILQQINLQLGNYRFSRPAYIPCQPNDPRCTSSIFED